MLLKSPDSNVPAIKCRRDGRRHCSTVFIVRPQLDDTETAKRVEREHVLGTLLS